ncbi:hypothetical protein F0562_012194 [Nyssa sinensis]|uniref:R13L1/DRL21-like LRR repeat region domain-containing protein n=1 Tax=Nyssa sinensis TaxID=561372 RepID=A0A5J4ZUG2_9ASTE|nr:hypothetical protein F0562_012194 [Nyssa sinensis]
MIVGRGFDPSNLARTRHFSIACNFNSSFVQDLFEAAHLRTLIFLSPGGNFEELHFLPYKFIYLRVLDLCGCGIKRVQNSINVLTYLRCLDLSNNPIQTLPNTICDLQNLQTLNLLGCNNLVGLPLDMGKVISLRHLDTKGCEALIRMPARIRNLVHLQTLPIYIVDEETRESILEFNRLNLRGELNIKCLENVRDAKEAEKANLRGKGDLHMLGLLWGNNEDHNLKPVKGTTSHAGPSHQNNSDTGFEDVEHVLKCLEPHPNLKKFSIKGYAGINFPHWYLPKLVVLELINCRRCKLLPTFGQFLNLKTLYLQGMDCVMRIAQEFYCGNS